MSAKWTFWAWKQEVKKLSNKLALLQLADNSDDDGYSFYSIIKMADNCNMSERTFKRSLQELQDQKFVQIVPQMGTSNDYILNDRSCGDEFAIIFTPEELKKRRWGKLNGRSYDKLTRGECQIDMRGVSECHEGGVSLSPIPNNTPNNTPKTINKRGKAFTPPTLAEVVSLFESKGNYPGLAEDFVNYYESNGWKVGRNKMKSVPHTVAMWVSRNKKPPEQQNMHNEDWTK